MDFDDLPDEGAPQQAQGGASGGAMPSFDDMPATQNFDQMPGDEMSSSMAGSFLRRGIMEAPAGAVGGGAGALAGMGGAAIGALTSPVTGPVGPVAGAVAAGVPAAMYAGGKAHDLEMWLLDKLGLREGTGFASRAQEAVDREENPGSTWTGELAGNIVPSMGIGAGRMAGSRVFGGALQGGMEAGQEAWNDQDLDPAKIAAAGAAGAVFAKPRGWLPGGGGNTQTQAPQGQATQSPQGPMLGLPKPNTRTAGARPGEVVGDPTSTPGTDVLSRSKVRPGEESHGDLMNVDQPEPIRQSGPDVKEGETLAPEPRAALEEGKDVTFAREQRDALASDDPLWQFWDEHMNYAKEEQAMKGPPVNGEFTYTTDADMSRANDVTTTSVGVAHENSRAPDVRAAGNPVGAPMQARIAARPSEPGRDYRKQPAPAGGEPEGTTTGEHAPDLLRALSDEHLDDVFNQTNTQAQPQPKPLSRMDPMEASRLTRDAQTRAMENMRARDQQQNLGEAFEPERPVQSADLTAAVTPAEKALVDQARAAVKSMPTLSKQLEALPPKVQAQLAQKILGLLDKQGKADYDADVRHTVQVGDTAVQTGGGKRADRKERAIQAWQKAYEAFGPGAQELPTNIKEAAPLARRIVEIAKEANGGHDPLTFNKQLDTGYKPTDPPAEWKWLRAIFNFAKAPTAKYFAELQAAHALGGDTGQRIDAEIATKKRPDLDKLQPADTTEPYHERTVHKQFDNSLGDESAVFKHQHDNLTNWLNALSEDNYKALSTQNDHALDRVLEKTQDPQATLNDLMMQLADVQRKNPPRLELAPAEDSPVATKTPLRTAKDVVASEGRVLDKNSPEFKRIAAEALAKAPKTGLNLDDAKLAERRAYGADTPKDPEGTPAVDGSDRTALEHWARFIADEGGAVPLDRLFKNMASWMHTNVKDFFTPRADPAVLDYGSQIGMSSVKLNTDITRIKMNGIAAARVATLPDGTVPLPAEMGMMYRAKENHALRSLPQKFRDYFDQHAQRYVDAAGQAYDELRDISNRLKLPGADAMPERKNNVGIAGTKDWMPRRLVRTADDETFEPIGNRGLSNWAESAQERDWMTLHNVSTGERKVYRINDDGNMVFYQNHTAGRAKTPPASFDPRDIGSRLKMANGHEWVADHSTIDELMAHGNGENGKPLVYSQNPVYTALNSYIGLKSALARVKLLDNYLNDPTFQAMSAKNKQAAEAAFGAGNFTKTILPQLADRYMPKPVAWAFDDMVKSGFNYGDNKFMDGLARFTQATLKPFYFFGPEVHVLNEADKFLIGRGFDNFTKKPEFGKAIKSVHTQDAIQAEIMDAGGNPMWAHAAASRALPQIAKSVGEALAAKAWKFDPIMKAFNVNTREVLGDLYQKSNKFMWWQSDVLYTALYLENKAKGLSPADAVHATEKVIDSYVVPTTMGKTVGIKEGSDMGRTVQQFMTDPVWSNFGRFHYGVYKMAANIVKNLLGPDSSKAQRIHGAGQAAMLIAMGNLVYPALSAGYQAITGNEHSEFEKRGLSRLIGTGADIAHGKKDPSDILRNVWSPSTVVDTGIRQVHNKDFRGKPILDASGGWGRVPGQEAEFAAGQMVSPYKTLSTAAQQGGPGWVGQRFVESNVGLKTPSEGAIKYEHNLPKTWKRNATSRERHPNGVIEGLVNSIVGR